MVLKYPYYPKPCLDLMQSKFQWYFSETEKNPKMCTEPQKILNSQNNSEKNKATGIILLDL